MRRIAMTLTLGLILGACSEATNDAGTDATLAASAAVTADGANRADGADGADGAMIPDEEEALYRAGDGGFDLTLQIFDERKVIRQAHLELQADDTRAAYDEIVRLAETAGGFVAQASVSPTFGDGSQPEVRLTLRIPSDQLTATMTAIKGLAEEVVSETQAAQDVTDQFIDLEARLTNLETFEVELRALLEEVRRQPDADPEKLLRVFNEISAVRGQIEQIQGQLNYLEDLTSLATLDLTIIQTPATVPITDEPWAPGEAVREALGSLVTTLQGTAELAIGFVLFVLPMMLLVLGIPGAIALYVFRRVRKGGDGPVEPAPSA